MDQQRASSRYKIAIVSYLLYERVEDNLVDKENALTFENSLYQDGGQGTNMSQMLDKIARNLKKLTTPTNKFLVLISSTLTFVMAGLIVVDIILRTFFNSPISGTLELEQYMLAVVVFLSLGYTMMEDQHVNIDFLSSRYSRKMTLVSKGIFSLLTTCLCTIFAWQNIIRGIEAYEEMDIGMVTEIPLYPFFIIAVLGCALTAIIALTNLLTYTVELIRNYSRSWLWISTIFMVGILGMTLPYLLKLTSVNLSLSATGVICMLMMITIMMLGMPIAFVLGLVGFSGIWYVKGINTALSIVKLSVFDSVSDYFFCVIPFFVLMGFICFRSGLSQSLYRVGNKLFGQLPGGLAIGTIFGCAGFAAICGDSLATAGTMGSVAIPEMKKYKYQDSLATACVAAGGTLGILIPPSVGFIIYGLIAEQSIGKLFMAGIIPGILMALSFSVIIYIQCRLNPSAGPAAPSATLSEKLRAIVGIWPMLILFIAVIGGIYMGFFTPTEGGAVGVAGAVVIGFLNRQLSIKSLYEACLEAMGLVGMIFGIIIGVSILGYFIVITEIPLILADHIIALPVSRYVIFVLILFLYVILGMVMNIIPMIMVTLPIIFPTIVALGFDPIWFGVIMVMIMEMGQITPPVGINVFVIAGVARDVPMATIYRGMIPFVMAMIFVIFLLTLFPDLALFIPNSMQTLASIGG